MPAARRSKSETTSATLFALVTFASNQVDGPGTGSAGSKSEASSVRQKYSPQNNSSMQMICAPRLAASRILAVALARFSPAFLVERIWIRPTVNLFDMENIVPRSSMKTELSVVDDSKNNRERSLTGVPQKK